MEMLNSQWGSSVFRAVRLISARMCSFSFQLALLSIGVCFAIFLRVHKPSTNSETTAV
jgi:hypothetical protein